MCADRIPVSVYLDTEVLTGYVFLLPGKRLLDLLNSAVTAQPEKKDTFFELTDVTIFRGANTKERMETLRVNKSNIHLLTTSDNELSRGVGAKNGPRPYPFVQKSPVKVKMHLPTCQLIGTLHYGAGQRVQQLIEGNLMFLPITDARIYLANRSSWLSALFTAVNRKQILFVQYQEISLA